MNHSVVQTEDGNLSVFSNKTYLICYYIIFDGLLSLE